MNRSDEDRINQLTSPYSPFQPPQLPLDFSDFLSLTWRADHCVGQPNRLRYYLACMRAMISAIGMEERALGRVLRTTEPGQFYATLSNVPFRDGERLMDASARKSAIDQLVRLRADVLSIGTYPHDWVVGWPGSGVSDTELRDRIFATLFTALRSQYAHFGRLLLVIDIVLQELLLGMREMTEVSLGTLIDQHGYPDPEDRLVRELFQGDSADW